MCTSDIFLGLIAILFPPIAGIYSSLSLLSLLQNQLSITVWVKRGICSADSLINILLCMLGYIPGLLHAWYIIAKFPDPEEEAHYERLRQGDAERGGDGTVTYYYVHHQPGRGEAQSQQQPPPQPQRGYGTVAPMEGEEAAASSSSAPAAPATAEPVDGVPPSYADAVKGDNKIQGP
jgi:uncharacterized membrane protein YqaE (UPF0057 family)